MPIDKTLAICCPKCNITNNINCGTNGIFCGKCEEPLTDHRYSFSSKIQKATSIGITTIAVGTIVGHFAYTGINEHFLNHRYPIQVEYELVKYCTDSHQTRMAYQQYRQKNAICACTLEKTVKGFSFEKYKSHPDDFMSVFESNISACMRGS